MDGFMWAEWPEALRFYWGSKTVPTPNPELVEGGHVATQPVVTALSPNGAVDDEDESAPDIEEQTATALPQLRPRIWLPPAMVIDTLVTQISTKSRTTGITPASSRCVTISFRPSWVRVNRIISIPLQHNPAAR